MDNEEMFNCVRGGLSSGGLSPKLIGKIDISEHMSLEGNTVIVINLPLSSSTTISRDAIRQVHVPDVLSNIGKQFAGEIIALLTGALQYKGNTGTMDLFGTRQKVMILPIKEVTDGNNT